MKRKCQLLALSLAMIVPVSGCISVENGPETRDDSGRKVSHVRWDTTMVVGSLDPNDTTLIDPETLAVWGNQISVLEYQTQQVKTFSSNGEIRWTIGRQGAGPGEFSQAYHLLPLGDSLLMVADDRNRKLVGLSPAGEIVGEYYYRHLTTVSNPLVVKDKLLWSSVGGELAFSTQYPDFHVTQTLEEPWPTYVEPPTDRDYRVVGASSDSFWVTATMLGPWFLVGQGDSTELHSYLIQQWHARRPGPWKMREPNADSAYWSARSVSVVGDEILFLFGGRPTRRAHPREPTLFIDVYDRSGNYDRSHRLPLDAYDMVTEDGRQFYFLTRTDDGLPQLIGLHQRHDL